MVTHNEARCIEPGGRSLIIKAADLGNINVRRQIKNGCDLFTLDGMNRLFLREAQTPHFVCRDGEPRENLSRSENDPAHNRHIDSLLDSLKRWESERCGFKVGHKSWADPKTPAIFTPILTLSDYVWDKEVTHNLSDEGYCRFDIAGRCRTEIGSVKSNTLAAIEVIYKSPPSQKTLQAQLEHSRNQHCIIMYCVLPQAPFTRDTKRPEYFLQIDERARSIRTIFYVYDGYGWKNGNKIPNCTAARLEEEIGKMVKPDPSRPPTGPRRDLSKIPPPA